MVLGLLTFLGGVAILGYTFQLALEMFGTPPAKALGVQTGKAIDYNAAQTNLAGILIRIVLLLVMGAVGSWIANRGANLIAAAAHPAQGPKNGA
jgi:hypothetical protein